MEVDIVFDIEYGLDLDDEHEYYNMDDGRDNCDQSFYEQMNIDVCGRESDCDAEDKEFWDKELGRNW